MLILIAATAIGAYTSTLSTGFLLDDYAHLDYAYKAMHGDWSDLARVFTGNWTGQTDNLTSYRPFISLSFFIDYLFWKTNSAGYHLSNLIMFAGTSILTAMLAYELSLPFAQPRWRVAMALASGLLFALYPLHPEAVAWIVGRVDVQCALFYLASIYCWFLFRRTGRRPLFILSLIALAVALPSKEMSVTLPAVVLVSEFVLPANALGWKELSFKQRLSHLGAFWAVFIVFAVLRTCALGTVVGGYGGGGLKEFFHAFGNFLDRATWSKVFFGLNEEMPAPAIARLAAPLLSAMAALFALRLGEGFKYWRTVAFLLLWAVIAELPTFQIWHIFPNLCGSRLLFLPSAPLCIVLALVAMPGFSIFRGKLASLSPWLQTVGAVTLAALAVLWFFGLQMNLMPWAEAGRQMRTLAAEVRVFADQTPTGKVTLLLDLPQDISGAGLLGRPEFLERLLRPPLSPSFQSNKVISAEGKIAGSHDFAFPHMINDLLANHTVEDVYKWNRDEGRYHSWEQPAGADSFSWVPETTVKATSSDRTIWLPPSLLNPLKLQVIEIELKGAVPASEIAGKIQLLWRSQHQEKSWIDYSEGPFGQVVSNKIVFVPSRQRSWLYQGAIKQIGFRVSPGKESQLATVTGTADRAYIPELQVSKKAIASLASRNPDDDVNDICAINVNSGDRLRVLYDCSSISGAQRAILAVSKSGISFPEIACAVGLPKKKLLLQERLPQVRGSYELPDSISRQAGVHQIAVLALDAADKPVGFFSEPISIKAVQTSH